MNFDLSIFVGICLILQNVSTTTLHCALVIESTCLIKVIVLPSKGWGVNAKPPVKGGEWGDCGGGGDGGLGLGLGLLLGSSDGLPQEDRQDRQQGHQQSQHGLTPSFWGHQTLLVSYNRPNNGILALTGWWWLVAWFSGNWGAGWLGARWHGTTKPLCDVTTQLFVSQRLHCLQSSAWAFQRQIIWT